MRDVILGLAHAGQPTTEEDLKRRGFSVSEIAELGPRAAHEAAEALRDIETAGIRRVRVPAATCAGVTPASKDFTLPSGKVREIWAMSASSSVWRPLNARLRV